MIVDRVLLLLVLPLAMLMMITQAELPLWFLIPLYLLAFMMAGLLCYARLAADRLPFSSLIEFYFWIAFGGMLGGMFNTLAVLVLFKGVVEYLLVFVFACFFRSGLGGEAERLGDRRMDVVMLLVVGVLIVGLFVVIRPLVNDAQSILAALALPAFVAFHRSRSRTR